MKLISKNNYGEEIVAIQQADGSISDFFIYRPERLNLNDTVGGIIRKHDITLNGYFVQTDKKWSVFVPSKEKHNEGEHVFIKITKEARQGKDANGIFVDEPLPEHIPLSHIISEYYQMNVCEEWTDDTQEALEQALSPSVPFYQTATIHIERTKTCWTIDVDSGNCTEKAQALNKKAAEVIVKEIAKRHLGGLILIDFIGAKSAPERIALEKYLIDLLKKDSLVYPCGWTKGRLFEIKRTRTYAPLIDVFLTGTGEFNSLSTAYQICENITKSKTVKHVIANPQVIDLLREKLKNQTVFTADIHLLPHQFIIKDKQ